MTNANVPADSSVAQPLKTVVRSFLRWRAVKANVFHGTSIRIGRGVILFAPHRLQIGHDVSIGPFTIIQVDGVIGDFTLIGMHVYIAGRKDHAIDEVGVPVRDTTWVGHRLPEDWDSVTIGRDVWIGARSIVLSGVSIGDGAIIGTGSVVTKDVAAFEIVVGNPASVVGRRFANDVQRSQHLALLGQKASAR